MFGNSQTGYNVVYETDHSDIPLVINGYFVKRPLTYSRLVFNDLMSFSYGFGATKKDPMKKSKNYGSKVFHHSILTFSNSDIYYGGVGNLPAKKHYYILDTVKKNDWVFTEDIKLILGYKCKKAFWTNKYLVQQDSTSRWQTDSTIAWYTDEIPMAFGPFNYRGLPGLVLKTSYQSQQGVVHSSAIKIEKDNFMIGIPPDIKIVSRSELKKSRN